MTRARLIDLAVLFVIGLALTLAVFALELWLLPP
jgi:large-conductance mechanosensitive channel